MTLNKTYVAIAPSSQV